MCSASRLSHWVVELCNPLQNHMDSITFGYSLPYGHLVSRERASPRQLTFICTIIFITCVLCVAATLVMIRLAGVNMTLS